MSLSSKDILDDNVVLAWFGRKIVPLEVSMMDIVIFDTDDARSGLLVDVSASKSSYVRKVLYTSGDDLTKDINNMVDELLIKMRKDIGL